MSQADGAYRVALEQEIKKWNGYERVLRGDNKQIFEEIMNMARSYALEGSNAEKKIVFQPMAMSIILAQDKRIKGLEEALSRIRPLPETSVEEKKPVETITNEPKPKPTPKRVQRGLYDFG